MELTASPPFLHFTLGKTFFGFFFLLSIVQNVITASTINIANGLRANEKSYAEFPPWVDAPVQGQATLEFKFKTNKASVELLFINDGKTENGGTRKNEFRLSLDHEGGLKARFIMGFEDEKSKKEITIGDSWNDMRWHQVNVTRKFREVTVSIDNYEGVMVSNGANNQLKLTSNLIIGGYVGGDGFHGCIKDVRYPRGSAFSKMPIHRKGQVKDGCYDTCDINRCQNDGKCVKYFDDNDETDKCDCSATGYSGRICMQQEKIGYLQNAQYITTKTESLRSSRVNIIRFRFRTNNPSGLILYHGKQTEYVLIEMYNGNMVLKMALGTDPINLSVGDGRLHDGVWHSVMIKRYGNQVSLNIDNDRFMESKNFRYQPQKSCNGQSEEYLYLGGHHDPAFVPHSQSRHNYEGCLQQVYFQINRLYENEEIIQQAIIRSQYSNVRVEGGKIEARCNVPRSVIKVIKTTTTSTTTPIKTTKAIDDPHLQKGGKKTNPDETGSPIEQHSRNPKNRLSQSTVAWITGGICVGSITLILTLACGFYFLRKRYSGQFSAQYKAAAAARGVYADVIPIDHHHQNGYHGNHQQMKRPKPSAAL